MIYLGELQFPLDAVLALKWMLDAMRSIANLDARHLRNRLKKWKLVNFSVPGKWNMRGGRSMNRLLVKAQAWYRPECTSCANLRLLKGFTPGVKATVAWCLLIEGGESCNYEGEK
ncbi:hypothetical protein KKH23_08840 [Patescibacteria group bacterium]|nr:hypothetical protein [Patescibacteria group bacterium]